jgi:hypothetical protein
MDHGAECIDLDAQGLPGRIDDRGFGGGQKIKEVAKKRLRDTEARLAATSQYVAEKG